MTTPEPPASCSLCPRLVSFREENQEKYPNWFNGAVGSFLPEAGAETTDLLIVGLAPGLQGANRTGRPFTGDWAGDLLYATLLKFGFAEGTYDMRPDDGLALNRTMITNAVRCVPPQNKPVGEEMKKCRPFLEARISSLPALQVIVTLGRIAHENTLSALGLKRSAYKFAHGAEHALTIDGHTISMIDSYHCSRYNTNTGRLTADMFEAVFEQAKKRLA